MNGNVLDNPPPQTDAERAALAEIEQAILASEPMTIREIADRIGVPKSSVQVIEQHAMAKLRRWMGVTP